MSVLLKKAKILESLLSFLALLECWEAYQSHTPFSSKAIVWFLTIMAAGTVFVGFQILKEEIRNELSKTSSKPITVSYNPGYGSYLAGQLILLFLLYFLTPFLLGESINLLETNATLCSETLLFKSGVYWEMSLACALFGSRFVTAWLLLKTDFHSIKNSKKRNRVAGKIFNLWMN